MLRATIALTTVADIVAAPVAGKAITVWKIQMGLDGTGGGTVHFVTAGNGNDLISAPMVAGSNVVLDFASQGGLRGPAATALKGTASANAMKGVVFYTITSG